MCARRASQHAPVEGRDALPTLPCCVPTRWYFHPAGRSLGAVVGDLQTAAFLSGAIGTWLPSSLLPVISLLLAMLVSCVIGSAWGTMGVLIPLVAPLAWDLSGRDLTTLTACLGAVIGGATFGNVSSPLADTSVLTAMVCKCDLLEHASSQATYTVLAGMLSVLLGALPVGLGWYSIWVALSLGVAVLALVPLLATSPRVMTSTLRIGTWTWTRKPSVESSQHWQQPYSQAPAAE